MSYANYMRALKMGQKRYQACVSKGEYPYLPVLDDILLHVDIDREISLGLIDIPLSSIVGTSTKGRTTAFANNFMPILDYGTEFGAKWANLCESHMEEGIREPLKVYEYMNKFYVVEGNKRVSVLKYFGAVTVPAYVTREIPRRTDDFENKLYYEFLDFYRITEINYVWFSQLGGFNKLLARMQTLWADYWTAEQKRDFGSAHLAFANAFKAKGGDKLPMTVDDALLKFLDIYSYQELLDMTEEDILKALPKLWSEFLLDMGDENVDLSMDPVDEKDSKKNLLSFINPIPVKKVKVAFVYDKDAESSNWIYAHELGRTHIEDSLADLIETSVVSNVGIGEEAERCIENLIASGNKIIFTTTPMLVQASMKAAVLHPDVKILNCSLNTSHKYIRTYYARMYEAKFLTGIIAGALTDSDKIGYVADYPIYGNIANINAFALGAKYVNPRAVIYLGWSTEKNVDMYGYFKQNGITYVSDQDMITPGDRSRHFGLYNCSDGNSYNVAMPVYHWGVFYEKLIRSIMSGSFKQEDSDENKALNYWWGMSAGVIELICSNGMPDETRRLVEIFTRLIKRGEFNPFAGRLYSQNGIVQENEDDCLTPDEIMKIDWLSSNIIGRIPRIDELEEDARLTVELKGVEKDIIK